MEWKKIVWEEICPICNNTATICHYCIYQLKPMGGIENDPKSICKKRKKGQFNFVTGDYSLVSELCKDKNYHGKCADFERVD